MTTISRRGPGRPRKYYLDADEWVCKVCKVSQPLSNFPPPRTQNGRTTVDGRCYPCRKHDKRFMSYGITREQFESMLSDQKNACAICREPFTTTKSTHIDHCHETGKVRGILCQHCNHGLGKFRDDPTLLTAAIAYLTR